MDRFSVETPGKDLRAEERTLRKKGIILAVVGALLIALAVLDGWPTM